MITLAIEISNPTIAPDGGDAGDRPGVGLGLVRPGSEAEVLDVEALDLTRRSEEELAPAIGRLLARARVSPRQIQLVAISGGPGGYTALRLACVTGMMLAEAGGAVCAVVPTAWAAAACGPRGAAFGVALHSKDGRSHVTWFDGAGRPAAGAAGEGGLADAEQLKAAARACGARTLLADEHLPTDLRAAAAEMGLEIGRPTLGPRGVLRAAGQCPTCAPEAVEPIYGREPEAVTKWRLLKERAGEA